MDKKCPSSQRNEGLSYGLSEDQIGYIPYSIELHCAVKGARLTEETSYLIVSKNAIQVHTRLKQRFDE